MAHCIRNSSCMFVCIAYGFLCKNLCVHFVCITSNKASLCAYFLVFKFMCILPIFCIHSSCCVILCEYYLGCKFVCILPGLPVCVHTNWGISLYAYCILHEEPVCEYSTCSASLCAYYLGATLCAEYLLQICFYNSGSELIELSDI